MSVIALDLGGTKLASALVRESGLFQYQETDLIAGRSGKEVGEMIIQTCAKKLEQAYSINDEIKAVGICVPGIFSRETQRVWVPNIQGWDDYPLYDEMRELISNRNIPIIIEGDRACYILGESWKGNAQNTKNAVFIAVGTGIGAGIMNGGEVLRGEMDITGAAGWMALSSPFQNQYKGVGCFEYYASGNGIADRAKDLILENRTPSILHEKDFKDITARDVFDSYELNDPLAVKVISQAVEFWGMAAANFISLFNPKKIIFGGGVFGPGKKLIPRISQEAEKWAQPISFQRTEILESILGGDAGLTGAAFQAFCSVKEFQKTGKEES